MFDERCIFVQYDLPNTKKRKKICTYENRINFITKWGQPMESTEIGGEAKIYESLWSGGNESRHSGFYFPVYTPVKGRDVNLLQENGKHYEVVK